MNRPLFFASLLTLALGPGCAARTAASPASPAPAPEAAPAAEETSEVPLETRRAQRQFRAEVHSQNMGGPPVDRHVVVISGERVRAEMAAAGREVVQIFLGPGKGLLFLDPQTREFARMAPNPMFEAAARLLDVRNPENPCEGAEESTCERLEEATHADRKVTVWRETVQGRGSRKLWVDEELSYALRMETDTGAVVELQQLEVAPVDEAMFEVPEGYTERQGAPGQ